MSLGFKVSGRIGKPVDEVFDAVVNPTKLSGYFTTLGGASAPLVAGTTVKWWGGQAEVIVDEVVQPSRIVLRWDGGEAEDGSHYQTRIEMTFEPLEDGGTFVGIAESGWRDDKAGLKSSYSNCEGWAMMLSAMKAYVEYGINLREGFYPSEMRGELPTSSERK